MEEKLVKEYDGLNEILYSKSFNIYDEKLTISNLLGNTFIFIFEKDEPKENQKDVVVVWEESPRQAVITVSKKARTTLTSGLTEKINILSADDGKIISFSFSGYQFGESLHTTINFYSNSV